MESNNLVYKSKIFPDKNQHSTLAQKKSLSTDDQKGLNDLFQISRNKNIELAVRQSALEQMVVYMHQHSGSIVVKKFIESSFNHIISDFLKLGNSKTLYDENKYYNCRPAELVEVHRNF